MSLLALLLMAWIQLKVPDYPGQAPGRRLPVARVFVIPGIRPILLVVLAFVLAHNILYTYIAPFLADAGMAERTDLVLLVFGVASLLGIWIIGVLIDRHLRRLTLASTLGFASTALALSIAGHEPVVIYLAVATWGLALGGAATLFQTALFQAAGEAGDVAQSMTVTVWNLAIAGGGIVGGILLQHFGPQALAPALLVLLAVTWIVIWRARQHGFPPAAN
ncbi:hypothetical protein P308_11475 [Pseudomonas piscis]|nr:hypothetical protein P308_11475 [Pseudomonas piscis]